MMNAKAQWLKVSDDSRFLVLEDGTPFFWLGDTAWGLFHRLNREDALLYLEDRAQKGFNVIQAVALAEADGIRVVNAYGRLPLCKNSEGEYDPMLPDETKIDNSEYTYWDHVDYIIERAAALGMYIAFLPTWGDKYNKKGGKGPECFTAGNAYVFGKWLGERYKNCPNIIWVLGGDRVLETSRHFAVINEMARGLKEGDGNTHLMTFHPIGVCSSSLHVHDEEWLDFNMIQSAHFAYNEANYKKVEEDYNKLPIKPTLDAEPRYEDHPVGFNPVNGYFDEADVRQAAYWAVFAGAFGHTYGHHSIWGMCEEPAVYFINHWKDALSRPGGVQMKHLRSLMESRPFLETVPDQELIAENYEGANHLQATRGIAYAFIYSPNGLRFKVNMGKISGEKVNAQWYDPRNGEGRPIGEFANTGVTEFVPPTSGRGNDWVLILDGINN